MQALSTSGRRPRRSSLIALVIATAVLYLAKDVLLPLALAILVSFLLAPLVLRLERLRLGRGVATVLVVLVALAVVATVGTVAGSQAVSLAAKLPEYRHTIAEKVRALRHPRHESAIGKAAEAIQDIKKEVQPAKPPIPVKETPATAVEALAAVATPFMKPLAMALAVIVFTILMLLDRENMRDRVVALVGAGRINVTTRALAEISTRVSRYLAMLTLVNGCFGIAFGAALFVIGIPSALLFGLLGTLLRFVPYVGVWVAAAMPVLLAFAISDGWSMALWTIGVFLALEALLAYVVEPWLYGKSVGLTPIAIIAAVLFWTWLWGPAGLLLATPLTVCVAVVGRHIPELGYLNVLLGDVPVLSPAQRFYQRLVALDHKEAAEVLQKHTEVHGAAATFDTVLVPALELAERDRAQGVLEAARERFVFEHARRIVEALEITTREPRGSVAAVCIAAARDESDGVAAIALARLMGGEATVVVRPPAMVAEITERAKKLDCKAVCISCVGAHAASHAAYVVRRLRRNDGELQIVAGLWGTHAEGGRTAVRLRKLGVNAVVTRLSEAAELLRRADAANDQMGARAQQRPARRL